jgi:hypothetical protein
VSSLVIVMVPVEPTASSQRRVSERYSKRSTHVHTEVRCGLFELDVELVREDGATGKNGKVTQDGLAVVTESGSLDSSDLELATELVQDASSESLAVDVFGDDDEGATLLSGSFEGWEDVLEERDLLGQEEVGLFVFDLCDLTSVTK